MQNPKNRQKVAIWAPSHKFVGLFLHNQGMYWQSEKNLLSSNISFICPHNMVNFSLLAAEICWQVWGTPANVSGFRVLAALLHDTLVVSVSQTLRRWTEGATYIRQGGHHVGYWPTVSIYFNNVYNYSNYVQCLFARFTSDSYDSCLKWSERTNTAGNVR